MKRLSIVLTAFVLPLLADPLADTFARLDRTAATFKGMTANIRQTVHTALVNDDTIDSGRIKLRRPKPGSVKILLELTNPNEKFVALDINQCLIYLPTRKSAQVVDLRSRRSVVEQGLLLGFGATSADMKSSYDVSFVATEKLDGQSVSHLKLVPRSKEVLQNLKQADLWLSDTAGVPVQQRFATSGVGDYTQFTYSDVHVNPALSDNDLKLVIPKGVQVQQVGK